MQLQKHKWQQTESQQSPSCLIVYVKMISQKSGLHKVEKMDDCEKAIRKNAEKRTISRHFFHIYLKELRETQKFLIWIILWI